MRRTRLLSPPGPPLHSPRSLLVAIIEYTMSGDWLFFNLFGQFAGMQPTVMEFAMLCRRNFFFVFFRLRSPCAICFCCIWEGFWAAARDSSESLVTILAIHTAAWAEDEGYCWCWVGRWLVFNYGDGICKGIASRGKVDVWGLHSQSSFGVSWVLIDVSLTSFDFIFGLDWYFQRESTPLSPSLTHL